MSEYQYYEFLAIDRPLGQDEMAALRAISSRARISPSGFVNVYHYGDLKADPTDLMRRYFDAHVYFANWMTAVFMLRLPKECINADSVSAFATDSSLHVTETPKHWLLTWSIEESEDYDRFGQEEGSEWMARLVLLREEIMRGDLRGLYVGWLAAVTHHDEAEDSLEPLALPGLGELTPAQKSLAEFLEVDVDLLAGAGIGSPAREDEGSKQAIDDYLETLSAKEMRDVAQEMLGGNAQKAERSLRNRFTAWRRQTEPASQEERRSVDELWQLADKRKRNDRTKSLPPANGPR